MSAEKTSPQETQDWQEKLRSAFTETGGIERFNLDAVVPAMREVEISGNVYTVEAEVPLTLLDKLLEFEEQLTKAADGKLQVRVLRQLQDELRDYLAVHNDDVPEDLGLSTQRIPLLTNYLMNGRTATEAVVLAMSGGPLQQLVETLSELRAAAQEEGVVEEQPEPVEVARPLAPVKRSSQRSSASRKSTTGRRAGGTRKTSARSSST